MLKAALPLALLLLAACDSEPAPEIQTNGTAQAPAPLAAPAPGEPRGLPDAGTPQSEEPGEAGGPQEAATRLETYYALVEAGDYDAAWALRWRGKGDDAASKAAFAASFDQYAEYHAQVGAPSPVSGAAGSLYVDIPVQIYGRMKNGAPFASAGTVTMRRVNDVPGSTAEQREWRVYSRD